LAKWVNQNKWFRGSIGNGALSQLAPFFPAIIGQIIQKEFLKIDSYNLRSDDFSLKTSQNMRYFTDLFGCSE